MRFSHKELVARTGRSDWLRRQAQSNALRIANQIAPDNSKPPDS